MAKGNHTGATNGTITELGLYEAREKIYGFEADGPHADRHVAVGTRFNLVKPPHRVDPYPEEQLYYEIAIGTNRIKVFTKELEGKVTFVPI